MNCKEFEATALEFVRGDATEAPTQQNILAHARTCAHCARRLGAERLLTNVVAAVIAQDWKRCAPPRVENALVTAFRERQKHKRNQRVRMTPAIAAAIAAGLMLAAVMTLRRAEKPNVGAVKQVLPAPAPVTTPVIAPVYREAKRRPPRTWRAGGRKQPNTRTAPAPREIMTDFMPMTYDPHPIERGRVVRVRLPRTALAAFGLPVNEQQAEQPIRADVVLGEDGLARAIRFIE
jgi:hypothetical protein